MTSQQSNQSTGSILVFIVQLVLSSFLLDGKYYTTNSHSVYMQLSCEISNGIYHVCCLPRRQLLINVFFAPVATVCLLIHSSCQIFNVSVMLHVQFFKLYHK